LAETGRSSIDPSHAPSRHIQATSSTLADCQIGPTKSKNAQKATIVYTDHAPTLPTSAVVVSESADSAIGGDSLELRRPRHYKSQPLLKLEQPNLRRTQSRLLRQPGDLMAKQDDTAALYVDAFEQQLQHVDAAAYIQQQRQEGSQQVCNMDTGRSEDDEQYAEPRAEPQAMKDPPAPSVLAEPEEYWDEDADEVYDDQGYTTAHSYRSHGDNTTGGVTTMLAPKVTAKVRKELEVAKAIVEEHRTQEEVEEETWDVSMVAEYGDEIFDYMRELEVRRFA
jgi:G2/mitotic-specific cyclin 3/4